MNWTILLMLFISTTLWADVSPEHVESRLQQMVREHVISATEAEKVKIRMKLLGSDQAIPVVARGPASAPSYNRIAEGHGVDLDGAQFRAIQDEVRKIVPRYHD